MIFADPEPSTKQVLAEIFYKESHSQQFLFSEAVVAFSSVQCPAGVRDDSFSASLPLVENSSKTYV